MKNNGILLRIHNLGNGTRKRHSLMPNLKTITIHQVIVYIANDLNGLRTSNGHAQRRE